MRPKKTGTISYTCIFNKQFNQQNLYKKVYVKKNKLVHKFSF